jgi:hypothetical protein
MIHHAISILCSDRALKKYSSDKLRNGISITSKDALVLIMLHILYVKKTMSVGRKKQCVTRYEIISFAKELGHSQVIPTRILKHLISLGYVEIHYHKYRPTHRGRIEIKKIGLYLSRLVRKHHCQAEKLPSKKE